MSMLQFERFKRESRFLSPLNAFSEDIHVIEHRRDPLTGTMSLVGHNIADKAAMFFGATDQELIQRIVQNSQATCFMCPEKVRTMTPKYPPELLPDGRIIEGESTLFPNLFPLSEFHAVCALTRAHYLPPQDFTAELLSDGIHACLEFIRRARLWSASLNYATINWNYLFPAGASVVHPHLQVLGGDIPYTFLAQMLDGSQRYFDQFHSNYWSDLITTEQELEERYIGRTGDVEWVASFAPRGVNEIQGILRNKHHFLELAPADILALAEGLSKILAFYAETGHSTFNLAIYSGPLDSTAEWFWTSIRIISRVNVYENYRASEYFLQKLLGNEVLLTSPEALAHQLKPKF